MNYTHETSRGACSANCQARDMEFVALYNDTLKLMIDRGVAAPRREAIRFTIHNGHPRYHVSYKRAYAVVCQLMNHGKMPINPSQSAQMWVELTNRVEALCRNTGLSIARAVEFVLQHCRATRFYISEAHADSILDRARRQYRQQKLK